MEIRTVADIAKEIMRRRVIDEAGVFEEMVSVWEGRSNPAPESDELTNVIQNVLDEELRYISRAEKAAAGALALDARTVEEGTLWGTQESEIGEALITDLVHETLSRACYGKSVEGVNIDATFTDGFVDGRINTIAARTAEANRAAKGMGI